MINPMGIAIAMPAYFMVFLSLGFMVVVLLLLFAIGVGQFVCFANLRIFSEFFVHVQEKSLPDACSSFKTMDDHLPRQLREVVKPIGDCKKKWSKNASWLSVEIES